MSRRSPALVSITRSVDTALNGHVNAVAREVASGNVRCILTVFQRTDGETITLCSGDRTYATSRGLIAILEDNVRRQFEQLPVRGRGPA